MLACCPTGSLINHRLHCDSSSQTAIAALHPQGMLVFKRTHAASSTLHARMGICSCSQGKYCCCWRHLRGGHSAYSVFLGHASCLQFERFCRPYYTAGFNAYELVEAAMVSRRAETVGECQHVEQCRTHQMQRNSSSAASSVGWLRGAGGTQRRTSCSLVLQCAGSNQTQ